MSDLKATLELTDLKPYELYSISLDSHMMNKITFQYLGITFTGLYQFRHPRITLYMPMHFDIDGVCVDHLIHKGKKILFISE